MLRHRWRCGFRENAVDERPQFHRFVVGDEVRLARGRGADVQPICGVEMRLSRVVDVRDIDPNRPSADALEFAGPRAGDDARDQVRVARSENQVRAERHRGEVRAVGGEHRLLGLRLRLGVVRLEALRVRQRLVRALHVGTAVNDARRGGVHEPPDAVLLARGDDVLRAGDVGVEVVGVPAPHAGLRGDVEHDVAPDHGLFDVFEVGEVTEALLGPELVEPRVARASERADGVPPLTEQSHDRPAEEATATGHHRLHACASGFHFGPSALSAHTASFSRKIFELCRTSTGKMCA